jgi:hypothetical protein
LSLDKPADRETPINVLYSFDARPGINAVLTPYALTRHLRVPVQLSKAERVTEALLDSGAMGNFIHEDLVSELKLVRTPRQPLPLMDVKGWKIGEIAFQVMVELRAGAHEERIVLDVAPIGSHRIILGLPWLQMHDPVIQWSTGHVQFTSSHCNINCLPQPHDVFTRQTPIQKNTNEFMAGNQIQETDQATQEREATGVSALEPDLAEIYAIDLMPTATEGELKEMIPTEYHEFLTLANPEGPLKGLPPLRPGYDFEIQLDPNKPLPRPARPYHMGPSEREDWIKWRDNMLQAGHILHTPTNTPTTASFFFIQKKDGSRCLVIDYRKLNDITIKDSHPLPRIDEILERMQGAKIYSKFDLKNRYNLL